ncbi:MAG: ATP-binding protein [Burkholderiaceae bacterium]
MSLRFGLAARMLLVIVAVNAFVAIVGSAYRLNLLTQAIEEVEVQRAASLRRAIGLVVDDRVERLMTAARFLGEHPTLVAAAAGDAPPAERRRRVGPLLDKFNRMLDVDVLEVIARDRSLLYRADAPFVSGEAIDTPGLADALAGKEAAVTAPDRSGLALRVFVPLGAGQQPAAALAVGLWLDDSFARAVGEEVGAEIAILSAHGAVLAASMPHAQLEPLLEPDAIERSLQEQFQVITGRGGADQTTVYFAQTLIDQTYVWRMTVDSSQASAQFAQARSAGLQLTAWLALLSAALLGWLAHRHARKLRALQLEAEQAVQRIGASPVVASRGGSELDSLAVAMREMTRRMLAHTDELQAARDAADAANIAKSAFLANMSHEIRTPMHGVLGMAELLDHTPLSAQQRKSVDMLRQSGKSMLALLDSILDLSKIEAGRLELEDYVFDLDRTVRASVDLMAPWAARKGLALSLEVGAGLPARARGDPMRIQQVLNNLLGNAIKFTESGAIRVVFAAAPDLGESAYRICVKDTGPGIAPAAIGQLFQPFAQGDNTTIRKHGGSGLGLAIALRIVQAMGGTLTVESELGRGSTFCFTMHLRATFAPRRAGAAASHELVVPSDAHTGPDSGAAARDGALRVLVAEDNPVSQRYAQSLLQQLGHDADVADNGKHAVQKAVETGYDVILMDCRMPVLDGYDATRQIRRDDLARGVPRRAIFALTASAMAEDHERCSAAGMDGVLVKPFTRAELAALLERVRANLNQASTSSP